MCIDVDMQYSQGCKCADLFKEKVRTMKIWSSLRKETASPPNNSARTCRGTASNLHMAPRYANQDFTSTRRKLKIWILSIKAVALSPVFAKKTVITRRFGVDRPNPAPRISMFVMLTASGSFCEKNSHPNGWECMPMFNIELGGWGGICHTTMDAERMTVFFANTGTMQQLAGVLCRASAGQIYL